MTASEGLETTTEACMATVCLALLLCYFATLLRGLLKKLQVLVVLLCLAVVPCFSLRRSAFASLLASRKLTKLHPSPFRILCALLVSV